MALPEEAVQALSVSSDSSEEIERPKCPICFAGDYDGDKCLVKGCYHAFCLFCIMQWAEMTRACPLCKHKIVQLVTNLNDDNGTFTLVDLDAASSGAKISSSKPKSMQSISQENIHQLLRRRVYQDALHPSREFSGSVPFDSPNAAETRNSSFLENVRKNWLRKTEIWIKAEAPVVFNHHLVVGTLSVDQETLKEQEIKILLSMVTSLLQSGAGDLRQSPSARTQLSSLIGDDADIFIRDLMLFLHSPCRTPQEFDAEVQFEPSSASVAEGAVAISVSSDSEADGSNEPRRKRRKTFDAEPAR